MARAASPLAAFLAKDGGTLGQRVAAFLDPTYFGKGPGAAANVVAARNGDDDGSTLAGPLASDGAAARRALAARVAAHPPGVVGPVLAGPALPLGPGFTSRGTVTTRPPAPGGDVLDDAGNFAVGKAKAVALGAATAAATGGTSAGLAALSSAGSAALPAAVVATDVGVPIVAAIDIFGGDVSPIGNPAGLSPQQQAEWNALKASATDPKTGQLRPGVDLSMGLARIEGRAGTKQILTADGYETVGGVGLGGPGFSRVGLGTRPGFRGDYSEARRPLASFDPTDGDPSYASGSPYDGDEI